MNRLNLPSSQRLNFRPITSTDLSWIVEMQSDPAVMRFITGGTTHDKTQTEKVTFAKLTRFNNRDTPFNFYALDLKDKKETIGWLHLKPWWGLKSQTYADLGYRLRRKFWGNGYATEATRALIDHAFHVWRFHCLYAHALKGNRASQDVMQKSGMSYAGEFIYLHHLLPNLNLADRRAVIYQINRNCAK